MLSIHARKGNAAADLGERLGRLRWRIACLAFNQAAERFEASRRAYEARPLQAKYDPNRPRVPAGDPTGGQWTSEGGDESSGSFNANDEMSAARRQGGLPAAVARWTVREFVSRRCRASINRELSSQFGDVTIAELVDLARGGDRAARQCHKLTNEPRFRK